MRRQTFGVARGGRAVASAVLRWRRRLPNESLRLPQSADFASDHETKHLGTSQTKANAAARLQVSDKLTKLAEKKTAIHAGTC